MSELTGYPRKVSEAILPVVDVNKKYINVVTSATSVNTTIYTAPAGKTFFLTGASLSMQKDAGSDNTQVDIRVTPINAANTAFLSIKSITGTANSGSVTRDLSIPLPCSGVSLNATGVTAVITTVACIQGYLVDDVGA